MNDGAMAEELRKLWTVVGGALDEPVVRADRERSAALIRARSNGRGWPDAVAGQIEISRAARLPAGEEIVERALLALGGQEAGVENDLLGVLLGGIDHDVGLHFLGEPSAVVVRLEREDLSRSDGASNGGIVPMALSVSGTDTYVRARVHIPNLTTPTANVYDQEILTGPPWTFPAWDTTASAAGIYTIYWEVENQKGCVKIYPTTFTAVANLACQITPTNPNLSPTNGKPSSLKKIPRFDTLPVTQQM